jgi:hypothetical protein
LNWILFAYISVHLRITRLIALKYVPFRSDRNNLFFTCSLIVINLKGAQS